MSLISTPQRFPTGSGYLDPTIKSLIMASGGGSTINTGGDSGSTPVDLSGYVTTTTLNTALSTKADSSSVTTALATKASVDALSTLSTTVAGISGVSETTVKEWIRGNGLFRGVMNVFGDTTMTDDHWQNMVVFPYLSGSPVTFTVTLPSDALGAATNRWVSTGPLGESPPKGTWTLLINPNNTGTISINFANLGLITAIGSGPTGSYTSGNFTIPQGRTVFLLHHSTSHFYYCFL